MFGFLFCFFFYWGDGGGSKEKEESHLPGEEADLTEIQYTNYLILSFQTWFFELWLPFFH